MCKLSTVPWQVSLQTKHFTELAMHNLDDPIKRVVAEAKRKNFPVIHPMIGAETDLTNMATGIEWWNDVK